MKLVNIYSIPSLPPGGGIDGKEGVKLTGSPDSGIMFNNAIRIRPPWSLTVPNGTHLDIDAFCCFGVGFDWRLVEEFN